jgi:hypothetical protein
MNRMSCLASILLLMFAAPLAWAAPDFSGTWVLNTQKGENLGMVAAIQETLTIEQTQQRLTVSHVAVFQGQASERQVNYDLTGGAAENFAAMGEKSETISAWDGDSIVTTWTSEGAIAGTSVVKTETRSLSADGSAMTVSTARADRPAMVLVYERKQ